jgi:ABC-type phosphate transport system permease subunit
MTFDKIYNDITTIVLPQIAEWLTMTKDYAFDLMGRYINYLIIIDSIHILVSVIVLIWLIVGIIKLKKWKKSDDFNYCNDEDTYTISNMIIVCLIIIFSSVLITSINNLIKDIYIPEVRIYEIYNRDK